MHLASAEKGLGQECVDRYMAKLVSYRDAMGEVVESKIREGSIDDKGQALLARAANMAVEDPTISPNRLEFLMNFLRLKDYKPEHIEGLIFYLTKEVSAMSVKRAFLHHPMRYDLFRDIAAFLEHMGRLDREDRHRLIMGETSPVKRVNFHYYDKTEDRLIYEYSTFRLKVDTGTNPVSLRDARNWMKKSEVFEPVEAVYLEKGIIVTYNIQGRNWA